MYKEIKQKKFLERDGEKEILAIYEGDFVRFYRIDGDKRLDEDVLIEGDFRLMTKEEGWKEIL